MLLCSTIITLYQILAALFVWEKIAMQNEKVYDLYYLTEPCPYDDWSDSIFTVVNASSMYFLIEGTKIILLLEFLDLLDGNFQLMISNHGRWVNKKGAACRRAKNRIL